MVYPAGQNDNIGDFVICAGLCYELYKKKKKKVAFYCKKGFERFGFFYKSIDFFWIDSRTIDFIMDRIEYTNQIEYEGENYLYLWFKKNERGECVRDLSYNFAEEYKANLFGLNKDTWIEPPSFGDIPKRAQEKLREHYILDKKTIIICPYDGSYTKSSTEFINRLFWDRLVDGLKNNGFRVYTNVYGEKQKAINGSDPIEYQGDEIPYIANSICCFIGVRSGFLDLLALIGAKIYCVTNVGTFHYDLKKMFPLSNCFTYYLAERFFESLYNNILRDDNERIIIDALNIDLKLMPSINKNKNYGADIFLSLDDMLQTMLLDVKNDNNV